MCFFQSCWSAIIPALQSFYHTLQTYVSQMETNDRVLAVLIHFTKKRSCGKVMFLHLSVILFTGGGVSTPVHAGIHTPLPREADPPQKQTPPGKEADKANTPPPSRRLLLRTVRILLERILVWVKFLLCANRTPRKASNVSNGDFRGSSRNHTCGRGCSTEAASVFDKNVAK